MLSISNLSHHFTGNDLFANLSLSFYPKERVGIVGRNGCGKTTLLNIIAGKLTPTKGDVSYPASYRIGYLEQNTSTIENDTLFNEASLAIPEIIHLRKEQKEIEEKLANLKDFTSDAYPKFLEKLDKITHRLDMLNSAKYVELVEKTLLGLGFERTDFNRSINEFSGGWIMRVELAKLLIQKPEIILLDEPTNHLDILSITWLEEYLVNYPGIVLLVSHDRSFLDAVCTRTVEITHVKTYDFKGTFSEFSAWKDEQIENQIAEQNKINKEVAQIKRFIERFRYKSSKAKQVQSRIKMLDKLEDIDVEFKDTSAVSFNFPPAPPSGKIVVEAKNLTKNYDQLNVFRNLDFIILQNETVAFIGKNGEGKSTLAKIITGNLDYEGYLKIGHNVSIGYFAQNQADLLDKNKTVYQTMDDIAVGDARKNIRGILGSFLFDEDDIDKKVSVLSGGEKTRLAIACMLLRPYNLLVLDEPTNHLDMVSKDILKNALLHFGGTMIIVSHDRDFLSGLSDKVFDFHNHKIKQYSGGIEEYLYKNKFEDINEVGLRNNNISKETEKGDIISENKINYIEQKKINSQKRRLEKEVSNYESKIKKLEDELKTIEMKMNSPNCEEEVFNSYGKIKKELDQNIVKWEEVYEKFLDFID